MNISHNPLLYVSSLLWVTLAFVSTITVYCRSFEVEKFCSLQTKLYSLENICSWMVVLHGKAYLLHRLFHWEKFQGTDQSVKPQNFSTSNNLQYVVSGTYYIKLSASILWKCIMNS